MANVSYRQSRLSEWYALCLLGLALLAAVASVGCKKADASAQGQAIDSAKAEDKGILHLEPFVVNLADAEDNRFLRVGVDLGLAKPLSEKDGAGFSARIRDSIILVLSTWRSDALLAPDGKLKLKEELLRTLQERVPELAVKDVYFTDFLVQR